MLKRQDFFWGLGVLIVVLFVLLTAYHIVLILSPLDDNQQLVFDFLKGDISEDDLSFTESEVEHLYDVQSVMKGALYSLFIFFILVAVMFWYVRDRKEMKVKILHWSGLIVVVINVILLFSGLFFFDKLFVGFHLLFFPQGNWQFPVDSLLIQTFPASFFLTFALWMFLLNVVIGVGLFLIGKWFQKRN